MDISMILRRDSGTHLPAHARALEASLAQRATGSAKYRHAASFIIKAKYINTVGAYKPGVPCLLQPVGNEICRHHHL